MNEYQRGVMETYYYLAEEFREHASKLPSVGSEHASILRRMSTVFRARFLALRRGEFIQK